MCELQLVTVFVKMEVLSTAHPVCVTVLISSVEISVKVSCWFSSVGQVMK